MKHAIRIAILTLVLSVLHFTAVIGSVVVDMNEDSPSNIKWWHKASVPVDRVLQFPITRALWTPLGHSMPFGIFVVIALNSLCWTAPVTLVWALIGKKKPNQSMECIEDSAESSNTHA